jgi:hypothetical protein
MAEIFASKDKGYGLPEIEEMVSSGKYRNQWGSLLVNPENVNFESLDNDESIVLLGRRHFITNLGWIFISCLLFFVPMFWDEFPLIAGLNANVHFSIVTFWYLGLAFYAMLHLLTWFYNVYIVTNERLITVEFMGILSKSINVTQLNRIEDVSYSQRGMTSSFFNFGDVIAETASEQRTEDVAEGERSTFTFESVGNPNEVVKVISDLMEIENEKYRR